MSINPHSSPEHISLTRVIAHVAAVSLSSSSDSVWALFNTIIKNPAQVCANAKWFQRMHQY